MKRRIILMLLSSVLCACLALPALAEKLDPPISGTTPVVSSLSSLGEFPVLVSEYGSEQGWMLNVQKICRRLKYLRHPYLPSGQIVDVSNWDYILSVTDRNGNPVDPYTVSGKLVFPVPKGVQMEHLSKYNPGICIFDPKTNDYGEFSIEANTLTATEYGGLEMDWFAGNGEFELTSGLIEPKCHDEEDMEDIWDKLRKEVNDHPEMEEVSVSTADFYPNEFVEPTTFAYNRKTQTYTVSGGVLRGINADPYFTKFAFDEQPPEDKRIHYTFVLKDIILLDYLNVVNIKGHDLTLIIEDSVGGYYDAIFTDGNASPRWGGFNTNIVHDEETGSTSVEVISNTTLCAREGYTLYMYMEKDYRLHIKGSGQILNSTGGPVSFQDDALDVQLHDYKPIYLPFYVQADTNAEAVDSIQHMLANNLKLSGSMFSKVDKKNVARVETFRTNSDGEKFRTKYHLIPVCYSEEDLAAEEFLTMPRLLIEGSAQQDAKQLLVSKLQDTDSDHYELDLVDADNYLIPLTGKASLYMPFSDPVTKENANKKVITFYHPTMFGDEIYTTHPQLYPDAENVHKLTVTGHGLKLNPSSFSPYISVVEDAPETPDASSLPTTGDTSAPLLWLALMAVSAAAAALLRRRQAA